MTMVITSRAFKNNESIPSQYTCDGKDVSPPLCWSGAPQGTKTYALIVDDPDAPGGTFTHWVIFNIPSSESGLQENVPKTGKLPNGAIQGKNDFGRNGYGGPCPPSGTHRYQFHLYALDTQLNLPPGATKQDLQRAMRGHILAKAELIGLYSRH
ncbi:MAG: YbhB/YbcL family Raf kinase inhibitor-like protein [Candidatus Bathyarchaeia archaeon]